MQARKQDLVGFAEVADLLGTSRQQLVRWTQRDDFPEPIVRLRATPVWEHADIVRWKKTAKPNGRRKR